MESHEILPIDPNVLWVSVIVLGIGAFLLAGFFGVLGVILVCLGAQGTTHITIFHGSFQTTDVGVASLCVGAIIVIAMLIRISGILRGSGGSRRKRVWGTGQRDEAE